ncbi:MAG: hypothetical protein O7E57_17355 [Gammaproteobacteria bacterium]|nr:hypothetical protein [Gammaproteobacteria bacterium]
MSIRCEKDWLSRADTGDLHGHMGVFQLGNEAGEVLFIGYAGGRSLFGLKGEIQSEFERLADASCYRFEINTAYLSRYQELLMVHVADYGVLPPHNDEPVPKLGRLSP